MKDQTHIDTCPDQIIECLRPLANKANSVATRLHAFYTREYIQSVISRVSPLSDLPLLDSLREEIILAKFDSTINNPQ